jgi:hypothetical protein
MIITNLNMIINMIIIINYNLVIEYLYDEYMLINILIILYICYVVIYY